MHRWLRLKWRKYYHITYRILAVLATISIIILFLPKSGQFKYEYEKGRPWRHPNLIAPFDFPVYKSASELKVEKDSLLRNFRPYFSKDDAVAGDLREVVANHFLRQTDILKREFPSFFRPNDTGISDFQNVQQVVFEKLSAIYDVGIIDTNEELPEFAVVSSELMLIKRNMAEPYGISELYTAKKAYEELKSEVMNEFDYFGEAKHQKLYRLLTELDLNKLLVPDIRFNNERTEQEMQNAIKNISMTVGKVLTDQRIVGTGDIVDDEADKLIKSLRTEYESRIGVSSGLSAIFIGQLLIMSMLVVSVLLFLFYFKKEVYGNIKSITFIFLMMLLMIIVSSVTVRLMPGNYYIIPIAILPIILRTFFDSRVAFYIYVITVLIIAFQADNSFQFAILQIPAGMMAIFTLVRMVRRSQIVRTTIFIVFTYVVIYTGLLLWQEGNFTVLNFKPFGQFFINGLLILLTYPIIYILEKVFGFVSDVTLLELSDTNHPLLRQLAEKAPGTFQHSIQVGNLAQEVAYRLGANPLLVRAGAMYHDIGKLMSPMYFTENQVNNINPHNGLDFEESAQIIIGHVENGVKMAKKNELPQQIIDFIATHHGTTKAKYFYNSYINANPDVTPDESKFTYPGPTPFTKETAILMMADAIEATSRSLKSYSDEEIDLLVEKIVTQQMNEQQFQDAPITFREIQSAKEVFKDKLKNIYHARIEYPTLKKQREGMASK